MKRKLKFSMTLIILVSSILLLTGGNSQATLQANPNTHYKMTKVLTDWLSAIRGMEDSNGAMGLSEKRNTDLTSTEETINNIDVHCMKSTEYGAIAILSASGYGNPSNDTAITTTTGNNTGVLVNTTQNEWVASIGGTNHLSGANSKYYNMYEYGNGNSVKIGDALGSATVTNPGCAGWHKASGATFDNSGSGNGFLRGGGGIFSYTNYFVFNYNSWNDNVYRVGAFGRGVAVCGEGL